MNLVTSTAGEVWSAEEVEALLSMERLEFKSFFPDRSDSAIRNKRRQLRQAGATMAPMMSYVDKKEGSFDWREATQWIKQGVELRHKASWSQETAKIEIDTDKPICVLALSDTHVCDWATDHELLESITDEILSTPNLYVALLGDLAQMAIKLRSVAEVSSNMLPPELQVLYVESWLNEIAPKVLFATWDNHAIDREESQSGISAFARLQNRRFVYHSGIGHPDVQVGNEVYRFAVSHRFQGRSIRNPTHAVMRYLMDEGHDREIGIQGDYHVPGITKFTHGAATKVAIHTGSFQTNSGYAKRWFSIFTHPVMPAVILYPDKHVMSPVWSLEEAKPFLV
jgi:hypothetical protein